MIGSKLGQYEVTNRLGAGGMGEVYQAADTRLGRSVAIKVLPEAFAQDPDRLERFEREAKALAALNHPHIAAIYGIEEHDRRRFLVLELVNGQTLAERLMRGPMAPDEAIRFALQIAEALEAAHEKGIIHRDLKPANIKINPEGNIKVLDFGLAKAFSVETANANLSNSPTLSMQATGQGVILGTAAYMAPEQARGLAVDKRADIWAFGCVLYEMLTGRQTFQGELVSDILASVLARDPDYTALQANLHHRIKELIRRCLEKDPKKRWQAVGDVRVELEQALAGPERIVQIAEPLPALRKPRWVTPVALAGVVLLAILSAAAGWIFKPKEAMPVMRFSQILPEGQQFSNQSRPILAVSPDGSNIAYVANNQIYLRSLNEFEAHPVPGTNEGPSPSSPFFSPDGQWIGYWSSASSQLKKISIRGGAPVVLCAATNPFGVSWATDGTILFGQAKGIMRVSESGGNPDLVVATKTGEQAYGPELLPGGETVLFSLSAGFGATRWDQAQIVAHTLKSGERKVLIGGSDARYVPTGHLIYALENNLFAAPFDSDTLELKGGPVPITSNVLRANNPGANTAAANYSFSANGLFAHVVGTSATANSLVWVDRKGRSETVQNLPRRRSYIFPRLSPDGRRIAVGESGDIWIYELQRGGAIRLTRDGSSGRPVWDPKGLQIAYSSSSSGTENIFVRPADGSGEARQLTKSTSQDHIDSWSPDGRTLFFHRHAGAVDMYVLSLADGSPTERVFLEQPSGQEAAQLSLDGNWAVYISDESGRAEIYVTPYPGPGGKTPVSSGGGTQILWARSGELFYRTPDLTRLMVVRISTKSALQIGRPELLFEGPYEGGVAPYANYDVTADGQRLLMILPEAQPGSSGTSRPQINIVPNWFEELRQRAPVR